MYTRRKFPGHPKSSNSTVICSHCTLEKLRLDSFSSLFKISLSGRRPVFSLFYSWRAWTPIGAFSRIVSSPGFRPGSLLLTHSVRSALTLGVCGGLGKTSSPVKLLFVYMIVVGNLVSKVPIFRYNRHLEGYFPVRDKLLSISILSCKMFLKIHMM